MNNWQDYREAFHGLVPWSGYVPPGYLADFLGILTDAKFLPLSGLDRSSAGGSYVAPAAPNIISDPEVWFEVINWLVAARDARERFVMMSLGAHYGAQVVGSYRMLQLVNPLPCKLVAVEAEPENYAWMSEHLRDNGIDPNHHWLLRMAVSDSREPVLFPVGAPGIGSNNCFGTNTPNSRQIYFDLIKRDGDPNAALRSLMVENTTGLTQPVHPGMPHMTEVKLVSAITLPDLLGPFDLVDFIEADIQQSEIVVFPPCIDALRRKVRRIHIGSHAKEVHASLHNLFVEHGWDIVFSFEPNALHHCPLGTFALNDGVLTLRNPDL